MEPIMIMMLLIPVMAQADTSFDVPVNIGITPDNPLYFFDTVFDNIRLMAASTDAEKSRIGLEIAQERLLEIKAMINANRIDAAETAEKEHQRVLLDVTGVIARQTSDTREGIERELEDTIDVEQRLRIHHEEIDEVKERVKQRLLLNKERLMENDRLDLERVTAGLDNAIGKVDTKIIEEKQRITKKFREDFQQSTAQVNEKILKLERDVRQKISIDAFRND